MKSARSWKAPGLVLLLALSAGGAFIWLASRQQEIAESAAENLRLGPLSAEDPFLERSGRNIRLADLRGKTWVAGFLFTRCAGPCPHVMAEMAALASALERDSVRVVGFTVDPDHDTPEILAAYAANFRLPDNLWLLTGSKESLYGLIREGFKLGVAEEPSGTTGNHLITHSQRLVLIDPQGMIRGYYDSFDPEAVYRLRESARRLAREGR